MAAGARKWLWKRVPSHAAVGTTRMPCTLSHEEEARHE